jgi:hypothetical protein
VISTIADTSSKFSLLSRERLLFNIAAIDCVCQKNIRGDVVEIGVWKGGSMLAMLLALEKNNCLDRTVHLYDTFEGMTPSTDADKDFKGRDANDLIKEDSFWSCISGLEEVQRNISQNSKYPSDLIKYHKGDICKTEFIPDAISVLRLDTDWYESTKFELDHFYDKVSSGGIIIIDDYGWWKGCKKAVDEFLDSRNANQDKKINIQPIDMEGVYIVKP